MHTNRSHTKVIFCFTTETALRGHKDASLVRKLDMMNAGYGWDVRVNTLSYFDLLMEEQVEHPLSMTKWWHSKSKSHPYSREPSSWLQNTTERSQLPLCIIYSLAKILFQGSLKKMACLLVC